MTMLPEAAGIALRVSVTDRCPLRCLYCRPQTLIEPCRRLDVLQASDIVRLVRVAQAALGVAKVRLTGGEPLARGDIVDLVAALAPLGIPDLALTTNGQCLAARARPLHEAGSSPRQRQPRFARPGHVLAPCPRGRAGANARGRRGRGPRGARSRGRSIPSFCEGSMNHEAEAMSVLRARNRLRAALHRADAVGSCARGLRQVVLGGRVSCARPAGRKLRPSGPRGASRARRAAASARRAPAASKGFVGFISRTAIPSVPTAGVCA